MAGRTTFKTTFEPEHVIEPIYTGGVVALDRTGSILATTVGEHVLLTELQTGKKLAHIQGDGETITTLALTPNADYLITCSRSLFLRIYSSLHSETTPSSTTWQKNRTLKHHSSPVISSATDNTGTLLATGCADGTVKVLDLRGGFTTHTLHGHGGVISALTFFRVIESSSEDSHKPKQSRARLGGTKADDRPNTGTIGYRLASGSEDGKIRVWDLNKSKCIAVLDSHVSVVRALDYDSNHGALLSGSRDKTVMLWDSATWKLESTFPILEAVEAGGFIQGTSLFYTAGERGSLRIWDRSSEKEVTIDEHKLGDEQSIIQAIQCFEQSFILTVHTDQTLAIHSIKSTIQTGPGSEHSALPAKRHISGTYDEVLDLAYVGSSQDMLAVVTNTEDVKLLSLQSPNHFSQTSNPDVFSANYYGMDAGSLKGHTDIIICLDVDWSGSWVVTGSKDNTARLWAIDSKSRIFNCYAILTGHAESLGAVALPKKTPSIESAQYKTPLEHPPPFLITGSQDKTVKKWDMHAMLTESSFRATYTRKAHDGDINAIDLNFDSTLFASASSDRTIKIWAAELGETIGLLRGHKRGVWSVKFAPPQTPAISSEGGQSSNAKGLILTGSGDKTVKIWNLNDYSCIRTFEGHTSSVHKVLWIIPQAPSDEELQSRPRNSVQVGSAGGDGLVKVWNAINGELDCTLDNHEDRVWALAIDRSAMSMISGGGDGVITFWKNSTSMTMATAAAASTAMIEQDQELQNYIRQGSYRSAITLALQLNHPARLLALFTSVVARFPPDENSLSGLRSIDEVLGSLADEQLFLLLMRLRDWNSNAKSAPVAQKILHVLLKTYPASRLAKLRAPGSFGKNAASTKELFDGLRAYTERHFRRLEDLIDESYLMDFTLNEMDGLGMAGTAATTNGHDLYNSDVTLIE